MRREIFMRKARRGLGIIARIHSSPICSGWRFFGCYRMLASRFPFGLYYQETSAEIRVVAILDLRRKPSWIRRELRRRRSGAGPKSGTPLK